jgi:alanyl-tRNA synthetase
VSSTEAIYHNEPYARSAEVTVRRILRLGDFQPPRTGVVLDRSLCYPEGGGQPGDRGRLGDHQIIDTQKAENLGEVPEDLAEDEIIHIVPLNGLISPGDRFTLTLDWPRRYDYMQQHTGQHLLSAAFWHIGKYPTVSVHQGEDYTTIEFEAGDIPDADIMRASAMANAAILADLPVVSRIVADDELSHLPLRRELKASGKIRVLQVGPTEDGEQARRPGSVRSDGFDLPLPFDTVGCGGVHLTRTGEIRLIQHLRTERIRGRVRLYWKIGNRALADYEIKHRISDELGTMLSRSAPQLPARVRQMQDEITSLRREVRDLQRASVYRELDAAIDAPEQPPVLLLEGADMNLLRDCIKRLQKRSVALALLVGLHPEQNDKIFWCILDSENGDSSYPRLKARVLDPMGARGGGKAPVWQGSLELKSESDDDQSRRDTRPVANELLRALKETLQG